MSKENREQQSEYIRRKEAEYRSRNFGGRTPEERHEDSLRRDETKTTYKDGVLIRRIQV